MNQQTCRFHCDCGRHFSSLEAFDAHHIGSFQDQSDPRRCVDPQDILDREGRARLVPASLSGVCRIVSGQPSYVTVWTMAGNVERARARFGTPPESSGETLWGDAA